MDQEKDLEFKVNDRLYPYATNQVEILAKCAFYSLTSVIGAGYIIKNRKNILISEKIPLKFLIFPLASIMGLLNLYTLIDLMQHQEKYPELYQKN